MTNIDTSQNHIIIKLQGGKMKYAIAKKRLRVGLASVLVAMLIMLGAPISAGAEEAALPEGVFGDSQLPEDSGVNEQASAIDEDDALVPVAPEVEIPAPGEAEAPGVPEALEVVEATPLSVPDTGYQTLGVQLPYLNIPYRLTSAMSVNMVLDVPEASMSSGRQIIVWNNNQGSHQTFKFVPSGIPGWNYIQNVRSGLVLDIEGGNAVNGTPIIQWPLHGGANQLWAFFITSNNGLTLASYKDPNYCIDIANASTANGSKMILWYRHGGLNQAFNVSEAGWVQDSGKWYYYSNGTKLVNCSRALPDETGKYWHFGFDSSGAALTGEQTVFTGLSKVITYYDNRGRTLYMINETMNPTDGMYIIAKFRYDGLTPILEEYYFQ